MSDGKFHFADSRFFYFLACVIKFGELSVVNKGLKRQETNIEVSLEISDDE